MKKQEVPVVVQWVKGSGFATDVAQIQSLAWELPYAVGVTIQKRKLNHRHTDLRGCRAF